MPRKDGRTAVGWQAEPPQTAYLTPSFTSQGSYVSMGEHGDCNASFLWMGCMA